MLRCEDFFKNANRIAAVPAETHIIGVIGFAVIASHKELSIRAPEHDRKNISMD
jgi:hypothetical protein